MIEWHNSDKQQTFLYHSIERALNLSDPEINKLKEEMIRKYNYEFGDIHHDIFCLFLIRGIMYEQNELNTNGFIYTVTVNLLKDMLDKEKSRERLHNENNEKIIENFTPQRANKMKYENKELLNEIESMLTVEEADILKGYTTYEDEAERLGMPVTTLKRKLAKKCKEIREKLEK